MNNRGVGTLAYAVRVPIILKYMGELCGILAVLSLAPFAVTIGYGDFTLGLRYLIVAVILGLPALLSLRLRAPRNLQTNEAMSITVLAFMIGAAAMIYPFMGSGLSFMDALFEAISGITTTGLTTLTDVENHSRGFLFARAWLQWYGGLGVVVLSLALVMGPGAVARRLAVAGGDVEDIVGSSRGYARRVMVAYLLLTLAGIAAAMALIQDPFYSVVHVLTAVSTGGFSSFNNSLAHLEGWGSRMVLFTLCIAGAIPLALYYRAWRGGWRQLLGDRELQTLLVLILFLILILWMILRGDGQFGGLETLAQATATAVTAQTGSGFSTLNVVDLDPAAKATLIVSMLIGGGMGSTTGGIKIIRLLILLRLMQILLLRTSLPSHAVMHPRLHGHRLETEETQYALLFILLFILVIVLSWLPFLAYGYDPLNALFEVVSATATVGLSTGVTSPTLELPLKAILCLDMLLGRVEVCALLVLIYPRTWMGRG